MDSLRHDVLASGFIAHMDCRTTDSSCVPVLIAGTADLVIAPALSRDSLARRDPCLVHDLLNSLQDVFSSGVLASQAVLGLVAGYYLSQWFHLVADGVAPDMRLMRKKRRR